MQNLIYGGKAVQKGRARQIIMRSEMQLDISYTMKVVVPN